MISIDQAAMAKHLNDRAAEQAKPLAARSPRSILAEARRLLVSLPPRSCGNQVLHDRAVALLGHLEGRISD